MTEVLDHGRLVEILSSLGYFSVFLLIMLESLGLPLPGETVLVGAAIYAGQTHQLDIILIVFAAASGGALGGTIGFWLGRIFGPNLTEKYGPYIGLTPRRIVLGEYLYFVHLITRKSSGEMIRKLSVIESRKFSQSIGIFSLRNLISASANCLHVL